MNEKTLSVSSDWLSELKHHAGEHKLAAVGLALGLLAVLVLLGQRILHLSNAPSS